MHAEHLLPLAECRSTEKGTVQRLMAFLPFVIPSQWIRWRSPSEVATRRSSSTDCKLKGRKNQFLINLTLSAFEKSIKDECNYSR